MQEELEEQMGYGFANIKPDIQTLAKNEIFVFGSNLAGRHGKGAALTAKRKFGAVYGQGVGFQGRSYAIPTKDERLVVLPLTEISEYVKQFARFAENRQDLEFYVTKIGTGLAGYNDESMARLFTCVEGLMNVHIPEDWIHILTKKPFQP